MRKQIDDDDEILKDGETHRVSVRMMDAVQRSVAESAIDDASLVTDGMGGTDGLHRPGHRLPTPGTAAAVAAEAADAVRVTEDAMRYGTPPRPVLSLADARARADKARADHIAELNESWRPKPAA